MQPASGMQNTKANFPSILCQQSGPFLPCLLALVPQSWPVPPAHSSHAENLGADFYQLFDAAVKQHFYVVQRKFQVGAWAGWTCHIV